MVKTRNTLHLALPDEAVTFFTRHCKGRTFDSLMFHKAPWGAGQQTARMMTACEHARIPYMNFHGCRHTYASRLVMKGVPLTVVAGQLGHRSIEMVKKHYAT